MLCFCFGCGRRAEVASALDTCPLLLSPLALAGARRRNRFVPTVASVLASSQHKGGVQQLYSVITGSNGARGREDRQGCQDHDGHPEGHGHPGLGPRCHPPDARVLLPVGLIISEGVKISFSKYGENCVGSFNNVFSQTTTPHHTTAPNSTLFCNMDRE